MGDKRLNGLMLMAVEKKIVKELDLQTFCGYVCSKTQKTETLEQTRMKLF